MDEDNVEQTSTPPDFTDDDPAAMREVAERIAFRNRRRILLGIGLFVAFCIALSYLGPLSAPGSTPTPTPTQDANIP